MAKISTYPDAVPPALNDYVIGTDVSNADATKSFVISDILDIAATYTYTSYVVFFSQSGGNDPTITELYNTIGTITWQRSSAGNYTATAAAGTFPSNQTFFPNKQFCRYSDSSGARNIYMSTIGGNLIALSQYDESSNPIDGLNFNLEIRVYN